MELVKQTLNYGEIVYAGGFETAVDGDLIVPDIKPDVLKILQVDASSYVFSKEIFDGGLEIKGRVDFTILYIPDGEEGRVQSIRTSMDFSHKQENSKIKENCFATIENDISKVDFHVINSRKIGLKAIVSVECEMISCREIDFAVGVSENSECQKNEISIAAVCGMRDEEFSVKEMLEVPAGKSSIDEILRVDYRISDKELRAITGKIVVKGRMNICVLYLDIEGKMEYMDMEVPFTEVFDFPDMEEEMQCSVNFRTCDFYYGISEDSDGDKRIIDIELSLCAEIKAKQSYELEIVTDCFCPGYNTELIYNDISINEIICAPAAQNAIRDLATIGERMPQLTAVYNVITRAYVTTSRIECGKIAVEGKIEAYILYISEDLQFPLYSLKKEIPFSYMLDCPGADNGMQCSVGAEVSHTSYHVNAANEIELRCIVNVSANVFKLKKLSIIESVQTEEISEENKKGIVIYFVQPGDTLWSVAKNYKVTVEDVAVFNKIENKDKISIGQRLVIPIQK